MIYNILDNSKSLIEIKPSTNWINSDGILGIKIWYE